jgi:predicted chitinase
LHFPGAGIDWRFNAYRYLKAASGRFVKDAILRAVWTRATDSDRLRTVNGRQTGVAMHLARIQLFTLFRDTKWLVAVSIALAALLYLPAQIGELYRAILADQKPSDLAQFYLPLLALGVIVWFGANQIALESTSRQPTPHSRLLDAATRLWPILLGILPVAASSLGQYESIPANTNDASAVLEQGGLLPGSPFYQFDEMLTKTVGVGLRWSSVATILGAFAVAGIVFWVAGKYQRAFQVANHRYFMRWSMLFATIALIAGITASLLSAPVWLPQHLGTFVLIAIFALLLVGFCVHISLATLHHKFPFFPVIFFCVALFSLADRTDNHEIRLLDKPPSQSAQNDAASEFKQWFLSRDDIKQYKREYPVYLVAAQGGGIYAAYETAIFLTRMQDQCPAFRKHLFAISSVSGGSIGAAVFASVIDAMPVESSGSVACPAMSQYLERSTVLGKKNYEAGVAEGYARGILAPKNDLLSPLVAGTLFGDFTQRFWPWAIGALDRARPLEFSLESAGAADKKDSLLAHEYIAHWAKGKEIPALLLNTTDSASGRRVVFSPFTFRTNTATQVDSLVPFQSLIPAAGRTELLNPRLSTAAFVSARFPWVSPAATVPARIDPDSETVNKIRLVDGGYFDNSGVETAVDLLQALDAQIKDLNTATDRPKVVVKLIVLGGGHYPVRDSFALGETMEPIRALLSTRESRAYIAINKASRVPQLQDQSFERVINGSSERIATKSLRLVGLKKHAYELPLGWAMSLRTREIIENQSGHFWDCDPNSDFTQSDEVSGSSGDCVQLLIGHELNGTLDAAVRELAVQQHYANHITARPAAQTRLDKPTIVRCFAGDTEPAVHLPQARLMIRLLKEWDYYPAVQDPRMLAYVLGTALHETSNLRVFSENLVYKTPQRILAVFGNRFSAADPAAALAEATQYVNAPEKLANRVYNRASLGNTMDGDGWRYRGRGILPLTGRADYREHQAIVGDPLETDPDLMYNSDVATRVLFSHFLSKRSLDPFFTPGQDAKWVEARAVVAGGSKVEAAQVAEKSKRILDCLPSK